LKETATSKPKDGIWWKERHQNICRATKINLNESPISATSPTNLEGVPPSRRKSIMKEEELFSKKKKNGRADKVDQRFYFTDIFMISQSDSCNQLARMIILQGEKIITKPTYEVQSF
jgi:hypothetical protein